MRLWEHIVSYNGGLKKENRNLSGKKQIVTYAGVYRTLGSLKP